MNKNTNVLKKKRNVHIYKTTFITAAFNQSMKNKFLNNSERIK